MDSLKVNISKLKDVAAKINVAVEKNKLNPKAGWIEIESISNNQLSLKVSNFEYYLVVIIPIDCDDVSGNFKIHATITADTFIPLVSKLDDDYVYISERYNSLVFTTDTNEYTFPIIKEMNKVKSVDVIHYLPKNSIDVNMHGVDLYSISNINVKGLLDSLFSKEIQQYIYIDNNGAITFTENIYINDFKNPSDVEFKFLLNSSQAKLLKIFESFENVHISVEVLDSYETSFKVNIVAKNDYAINLTFIVQSQQMTDKFPSIKLRALANAVSSTHIIVDKKKFEKALQRLMVFDKKWDITDMSYSKIVFSEKSLRLVSIKSKNYEIIDYIKYDNSLEHESIIRFADLINQIKAAQGKELDISYGENPAIVINSYGLRQLIPEVQVIGRV